MATIDVRISQAVMDSAALDGLAKQDGAFDAAMDAMQAALDGMPDSGTNFTAAVLANGTVKITYPNGTVQEYTGVTLDYATAATGVATATGMKLTAPGAVTIEESGKFAFSYKTLPSFSIDATSVTLDSVRVLTTYATTSANYDTVYGNVGALLDGHLEIGADGQLQGSLSSLQLTADKFLASATLTGHFGLTGHLGPQPHPDATGRPIDLPVGPVKPPATDLTLAGKVSSLDLEFRDGSYVRGDDLGVMFNSGQLADMLDLVRGVLSGDDTIKVQMPAVMADTMVIASGGGNDAISIGGGGGKLDVAAGAGNDTITILSDHHHVDGGNGADTVVFSGNKAQYTVTQTGDKLTVTSNGGADVLTNVERLQFADGAVAYDIDGHAGQAWRMYTAAFDRAPDHPGLGYWIKALDGNVTLRDLADSFIKSAEFIRLYGEHASNASFIARLYNNVLHRDFDQAGFDYWVNVLEHGEARANVLVNFSEGAENHAQVIAKIEHGCDFTPFGS